MRVNYTPEEIAEMHDRNENFNGTRANFSKVKLYQAVKSDLVEFMNMCDDVQMIDGYDPNAKEKHAILWLDFSPAATLNKEETAALTAIMNKADGIVISMGTFAFPLISTIFGIIKQTVSKTQFFSVSIVTGEKTNENKI